MIIYEVAVSLPCEYNECDIEGSYYLSISDDEAYKFKSVARSMVRCEIHKHIIPTAREQAKIEAEFSKNKNYSFYKNDDFDFSDEIIPVA